MIAFAQPSRRQLHGHVSEIISHLTPVGAVSAAKPLQLSIGLPLRNEAELDSFLKEISDPASPNYRHYLTPEQFEERFAPTKVDYQQAIHFFQKNGFTVTGTTANRMLLEVSSSAGNVERTFHVTLRNYRHPTQNRIFYAPDVEPSVDSAVPILDVTGLSDLQQPYPKVVVKSPVGPGAPRNGVGSGPRGSYIGNDFRATYAPGVSLTGTGQTVALVQFDGYYLKDITNYENFIGIAPANYVTLSNILLDGFSGNPTTGTGSGNIEVSLDIEMVISMAPGLSKIILYEGNPASGHFFPNHVLNCIATNDAASQISSSWGWNGGPDATTEQIFKQMRAQGQTYFNASGDSDAFTPGQVDNPSEITEPSSSTNIIQVGATTLTATNPVSETVWNWGGGTGSSGGISTSNPIPNWQTGISMIANHGSTTGRNIPDVALTGDNIFVKYGNGLNATNVGGTSCAAPLWAGFAALVNQRAAQLSQSPVGFINPAIYEIGRESDYHSIFNDVTVGNNYSSGSPTNFPATVGYDLCTGWGSPAGANLINALLSPDPLGIRTESGFRSTGKVQGPFTVTSQNMTLTNSAGSVDWSLINTSLWLNASISSGTLVAGGAATVETVSLNLIASNLASGTYEATLWFSNQTTHVAHGRLYTLQVTDPFIVAPSLDFVANGPVGGPFYPTNQIFFLTNGSAASLSWGLAETSSWFNVSKRNGTLVAGASTNISVSPNVNADALLAGIYSTDMIFTNLDSGSTVSRGLTLRVGQSVVQNGGFETGDFTDWTLTESGGTYSFVDDGSNTGISPHGGSYLAALGHPSSPGFLSQTLTTAPGQAYLISLWFNSPDVNQITGGEFPNNLPNEFKVSWGGATLFDQNNIPVWGWTNMLFVVTASNTNTVLQFGERVDPWYLGLDDVNVWPVPVPSFRSTFETNNNAIGFTFNSLAGLQYVVQYSTNLSNTNWFDLSTHTATGDTLTITNAIGADQSRFYRIRRLP